MGLSPPAAVIVHSANSVAQGAPDRRLRRYTRMAALRLRPTFRTRTVAGN